MSKVSPVPPGSRLRLVATTVVLTSLAWIAGLAVWLSAPASDQHRQTSAPLALSGAGQARPAPVTPFSAAASAPSGKLLIPVAGVAPGQLVDTFSQARAGGARIHDAIDIMAPRGTPVLAAANGRIEKLFLSRDGGNTIYLRSPDRTLIYYYAHLDAYAPGLADGQQIAQGAVLGTVGSSGNADPNGPHLHFAIMQMDPAAPWYHTGPALNPYPLLVTGQRPELGARAQRSGPSLPSADSLRRNARPEWE